MKIVSIEYVRIVRSAVDSMGKTVMTDEIADCVIGNANGNCNRFSATYQAEIVGYPRKAVELAVDHAKKGLAAIAQLESFGFVPQEQTDKQRAVITQELEYLERVLTCKLAKAEFNEGTLTYAPEDFDTISK